MNDRTGALAEAVIISFGAANSSEAARDHEHMAAMVDMERSHNPNGLLFPGGTAQVSLGICSTDRGGEGGLSARHEGRTLTLCTDAAGGSCTLRTLHSLCTLHTALMNNLHA